MKALVLAAGYATRMYPYTRNFPKALLRVEGRPLLEALLETLAAAREIDTVYLVTNHRFRPFFDRWLREWDSRGGEGPAVRIVDNGTLCNEDRLGGIGDLAYTIEREGIRDDLLVTSSDKLFDFRVEEMIGEFHRRGAAVNACFDAGDVELIRGRHGCAVIDPDGRIVEFQEKPARPRSTIESVAFTILPSGLLPRVREYLSSGNGNPDAPGYFLEWLCQREPVYAWLFGGTCTDVGSVETFWRANRREVARGGLLLALVVDRGPSDDRALLRAELQETLRLLDRRKELYLAVLLTSADRVPLYEELLLRHPTRVPVAVKSHDAALDLERTGVLRELSVERSHLLAWLEARPDWWDGGRPDGEPPAVQRPLQGSR